MNRFIRMLAVCLLAAVAPLSHAATVPTGSPATTNNDDSCDIGPFPAATLLLPYFEVDVNAPSSTATTTLLTIVNTTRVPQIANVTLWTDWGYALLDFDIFLTGYDVQALNLYDVLARGVIAPPSGTTPNVTPGSRSLANDANPNFHPSAVANCRANTFSVIPASVLAAVKAAFTTGTLASCPGDSIGGTHTRATGFATIDVVSNCNGTLPVDAQYHREILYDNVLTGDYQYINPSAASGNYASGNPLVHIRAIPEGGAAGANVATSLPYTFYDRYTPSDARKIDRRQPLASTFVARFIQGGTTAFNTDLTIWREGITGPSPTCGEWRARNSDMQIAEVVRFDERENPFVFVPLPILPPPNPGLPVASRSASSGPAFPPLLGDAVSGWLYLNLNNGGSSAYSATAGRDFRTNTSTTIGPRQSQNWVSLTMFAEGRYSAAMDATQLANGCTPAPGTETVIGPGANVTP